MGRLMQFDQTFTTNGLWATDEGVKFLDHRVKGQHHVGVKHAPKCTFWPFSCHMLAASINSVSTKVSHVYVHN